MPALTPHESSPSDAARPSPAGSSEAVAGPASADGADESAEPPQPTPAREDRLRITGDALRRSLRWTYLAWIPGALWMAATSGGAATKLATYLGATAFWFGVMTAAPYIAVLLQVPGAMFVEALGRRKWFFIWTVTFHRVLYIVIGFLPWVCKGNEIRSAAIMILLIAISMGLNNLGGQAWVSWMADLVPKRVRGKYFANRSRAGIAVMIVTSLLLGAALDAAGTTRFARVVAPLTAWSGLSPLILLISVVFIVSGAIGMLDILAFIWVDEPATRRAPESIGRKLMRPLRDKQFMVFCGYWSIWTFAVSFGQTFWWLYIFEFFDKLAASGVTDPRLKWWVDHRYFMCFVMLPVGYQVGQFLGYPIWGRAVDRFGRKPVLFVSSTLHSVSWVFWIFLSPAMLPWMPLVQVCGGMLGGGQDIGSFNMMLGFNRKGGSGYQALGSVLFAVSGAAAALISGKLLGSLATLNFTLFEGTRWRYAADKYTFLIAAAVVIKYVGDLTVLPYVHDLDAKPRRETARFVFQNMYGAINMAVLTPVAAGLEATSRTLGQVKDKVQDVAEVAGANFKRWFR